MEHDIPQVETEIEQLASQLFDRYADARIQGQRPIVQQRHNAIVAAICLADERGSKKWAPLLDEAMLERQIVTRYTEQDVASRKNLVRLAMYDTGIIGHYSTPEANLRSLTSEE